MKAIESTPLLADQLAKEQRGPAPSQSLHVNALPPELLIKIFRLVENPAALSLVCRKWEQIIRAHPVIYRDAIVAIHRTFHDPCPDLSGKTTLELQAMVRTLFTPLVKELKRSWRGKRAISEAARLSLTLPEFSLSLAERCERIRNLGVVFQRRRESIDNRYRNICHEPRCDFRLLFINIFFWFVIFGSYDGLIRGSSKEEIIFDVIKAFILGFMTYPALELLVCLRKSLCYFSSLAAHDIRTHYEEYDEPPSPA